MSPTISQNRIKLGQAGEQKALEFLLTQDYQLVERNYRNRFGEIDLIVSKDEYLVFVEVKAKKQSPLAVSPFISITKKKRKNLHFYASYT